MRRWAVLATLALLAFVPALARAEPTPADRAAATALFEQGRGLLADGKTAEACVRFAESQRLDPSLGTLLNLANCHELEGKSATAWSELHEALAIAEREHQSDRVAFARTHIAALEPKLPRLVITLPRELDAANIEIRRDGTVIGRVAAASAVPVDPGTHTVEVQAEGYAPWSSSFEMAVAERRELVVGPLVALPSPVVDPPPPENVQTAPISDEDPGAGRRTAAYVLGGAGLAALTVGVIAGVVALSKTAKSESRCDPRCDDEGYALNQEAKTAADVSTVGFVAAGVVLGAGVFLFLTTPKRATALSPRGFVVRF